MSEYIDKNDEIYSSLRQLGLDHNESKVYISLLEQGEVGASKIVKQTGFHGQTVYDALYSLESKNLIRHNLIKGRKKFLTQDPKILLDLIEKQKVAAEKVVQKIEQKFSAIDIGSIEIIKGKESFILNEFKLLKEMPVGSELLVLGGIGDSFIKNFENKFIEYDYQRKKREMTVRYLGSIKQKQYLIHSKDTRSDFEYKYLSDVFSGVTNITVFKNYAVVIYLFDETITAITIRNKKIAESYTDFFESLWNIAEK